MFFLSALLFVHGRFGLGESAMGATVGLTAELCDRHFFGFVLRLVVRRISGQPNLRVAVLAGKR